MALSTQLVAGLSSGFDWRTMIDQLIAIDRKQVDLVESQKTEYEQKLTEWQSFNTKLLSLKTAAESLKDPEDFYLYTSHLSSDDSAVDAADLLSVTTSSSASKGSYSIIVDAVATAQKLSSKSFSDFSDPLGASYAGDILINGTAITINATDSLADLRDKINNANAGTNPTGVSASIITYASNDYRLILTSDSTGAQGIGLQNGSASDLVELLGWKDRTSSLRNSITAGAQSDAFSSSTQSIKTLLGLSTTQSGTIRIKDGDGVDQDVSIDLGADSLEDIKNAINSASITGVTASVIAESNGGSNTYRLQIDGSQDFVDSQNILETLGILESGVSEVQGTTSGNTMTANGQTITADTLLVDIDGYNHFTTGDKISLGLTSRDHSGNDVHGDILTITENTTVQDLLDAIEEAYEFHGDAVSVYLTSQGKIEVADEEAGAGSLVVDLQSVINDSPYSSLDWGAFSALDGVRNRELVAGADASLRIDGVQVTSSENNVNDVLPGVTLDLLKADPNTTVTLSIDRDLDAVMEEIEGFVSAYNTVAAYISQQQTYDQDQGQSGGILFGDGTLSSIKSDLATTLVQQVWGVSSDLSTLGLIGIHLDNEGQLTIDEDELREALSTRFNDVKRLFAATGVSDTGSLEYVSHSRDTKADAYSVNITQAAARSTTASDTAIVTTLGADETLTITEGTRTAAVALTAGMTLSDIVNAVNTELDSVYTESLVSGEALTAGSNPITSSTTWASVDGASLQDGDVIAFTGTARGGQSISGSYEIGQASSDTVQGLLSAIEVSFGNSVVATVDSAGRLVLTDRYEGDSQISLSFDYAQAHDLDFGNLSTANPGGQEGRYAMAVTASEDGSDHLVLTHDTYGSSHSFVVEESTDTGLWTWSQTTPLTVNNGADVAGTINGEAATGSGQILTGNDGEANVEGLAVKYSGSATGQVGTVTLTLGIAELFERSLYNITDPYSGYLAFKQDSLQNSVDWFQTRIDQMNARLDSKTEMMVNRFVAMELALARIQSQSQWLSGQISAAANGWSLV
jgi:flagellar hook-associated protein 2